MEGNPEESAYDRPPGRIDSDDDAGDVRRSRERDEGEPDQAGTPGEDLVNREAEAAAREAARIGGKPGQVLRDETGEPVTEEERAVIEGGGGVAEGFELADAELIDAAQTDTGRPADKDAFTPEANRSGAVYGDADHEGDNDEDTAA